MFISGSEHRMTVRLISGGDLQENDVTVTREVDLVSCHEEKLWTFGDIIHTLVTL